MPKRATSSLDQRALSRLLVEQDGIISRRQLIEVGASRADVRRLLRRGTLTVVYVGVYVDHTGPLSRRQREWAAVLACAPAALHRESALDAHGMTRDRAPAGATSARTVWLIVDHDRRLEAPAGTRIERVSDWEARVHRNRRPPRARFDFALLKTAADRDEANAIALISDAVHQGLTTAPRLLKLVEQMPRLPRRSMLLAVLRDVAAGTRSVLELRYLREVEIAHGLPEGERQLRQDTSGGVVLRDVRYRAERTLVELDGAFGHRDAADKWSDLQRDLDAAVTDHVTLRPGWVQVLEPCRLAALVGAVIRRRGWDGRPSPCGPHRDIDDSGVPGLTYGPRLPPSFPESA